MNGKKRKYSLDLFLTKIEKSGNKLPDPAFIFVIFLVAVWIFSWILSNIRLDVIDPRTQENFVINNLLTPTELVNFTANLVHNFISFPPLGVVLVAILGLGVAEYTGFINAGLRAILAITPKLLLTPALAAVGILSSIAVDAGFVLIIPLGGFIFHLAGRHPLAGISTAFAGVAGGYSATLFIPTSLDPLLAGITTAAVRISTLPGASDFVVNPLNNFYFTSCSSILIIFLIWFLTDAFIEPRLNKNNSKIEKVEDKEKDKNKDLAKVLPNEKRGLIWASITMILVLILFFISLLPENSAWRNSAGSLAQSDSPVIKSIVALIFIFFLIPGVVYGYIAGTARGHKEIIKGMSIAMSGMGYYMVIVFCSSLFLYAFTTSNLGPLIAIQGASLLKQLALPMSVTLIGLIFLSAIVNIFIGSASAKWSVMAVMLVPMMMELGISPDLTQAAYRVGDSTTNLITPLLGYFPLIVVFCQKYFKEAGIGTLISLMLPYSISLIIAWTLFLLTFWFFDIPLGLGASYYWK